MANSVQVYLLDQNGIDWPRAFSTWSWLLPPEFTLWLVNRFGDAFLVLPDGTIHMLDVGGGTLTKVAENRDDFCNKIDESDNANDWLMIPLVDELVAAGLRLQPPAAHCPKACRAGKPGRGSSPSPGCSWLVFASRNAAPPSS